MLGEVREWQSRALERTYPIVIIDPCGWPSAMPTAGR
ncbi:hypothetical protein Q4543_24545 [Salipiger sp. 1_MG-2023]|nr:hypothetical protein [Salipiger sp. 1_MG-2023]MDO6588607.1 hypothetical protein [Salipiger sp. 1_MG-2023]